MFYTQSQNASAKLSLIAANSYFERLKRFVPVNQEWNEIKTETTFNLVMVFRNNPYYFSMLRKTINRLIDARIMIRLGKEYYPTRQKLSEIKSQPKVLSMSDLKFGFHIWFGCCLISFIGYIMELFYMLYKVAEKMAFPPARPVSNVGTRYCTEALEQEESEENEPEVLEDTEKNEENEDEVSKEVSLNVQLDIIARQLGELDVIEEELETFEPASNEVFNNQVEVLAEVYKNPETEDSFKYFEALLNCVESRRSSAESESNAVNINPKLFEPQTEENVSIDLPKGISNYMDLELVSVSSMQESLEDDVDEESFNSGAYSTDVSLCGD